MKKVAIIAIIMIIMVIILIVVSSGNKAKQDTPALLPDTSGLEIAIPVGGIELKTGNTLIHINL